ASGRIPRGLRPFSVIVPPPGGSTAEQEARYRRDVAALYPPHQDGETRLRDRAMITVVLRRPGTIVLIAALAGAVPAARQQPTFRSRVELIRVDAVVTDANGQPIEGLTAADFTLYDRNKPQAIATFDEISHPRSATAGTRPRAVANMRQDVAAN